MDSIRPIINTLHLQQLFNSNCVNCNVKFINNQFSYYYEEKKIKEMKILTINPTNHHLL